MPESLPEVPDLELLKKRAKELLRAARAGEPAACRRLAPHGAARPPAGLRLADAQQALAREHGFASWARLRRAVAERKPPAFQAERLLAAIRRQHTAAARKLAQAHPEAATASFFAACACGEERQVAAALAAEPGLAIAPHAPDGWPPLLYLAASPLHQGDPARGARMVACARALLDRGADANSFTLFDPEEPRSRLPALYFACVVDHPALVDLLLARGAAPDDGESVFHAAEMNRRDCLEVLLRHGADLSGRCAFYENTPLYFLAGYPETYALRRSVDAGMRWLLEHGADPDVPSEPSGECPLHRIASAGRGRAIAEALLDHGAAVDPPRADGRTPYALAVRAGNRAVAALLRERGADPRAATPADELLGACHAGDQPAARALLARHPGLLRELSDEHRQGLAAAAEAGREATVRLMAALGFDLAWEGAQGGTALHHAAWQGNAALVRTLLEVGAPLEPRDRTYGSSPLAWAAHGSQHAGRPPAGYLEVVDLLLAAGATREAAVNRWGEPPESFASRPVAALLRRRGFGGEFRKP